MRVLVATSRATVAASIPTPEAGAQLLAELADVSANEIRSLSLPTVYQAARYRREWQSPELWQSAAVTAARRYGDCEDLVVYRVGELWATGADSGAAPVLVPRGRRLWHAVVMRGDGMVEDPSAVLGMVRGGLRLDVRVVPGGYVSRLSSPVGPGSTATAYGRGEEPLDAMVEAAVEFANGLEAAAVPLEPDHQLVEVGASPALPLQAGRDLALLIDVAECYGSGRGAELRARLEAAEREGASPAVVRLVRRAAAVAGCY